MQLHHRRYSWAHTIVCLTWHSKHVEILRSLECRITLLLLEKPVVQIVREIDFPFLRVPALQTVRLGF